MNSIPEILLAHHHGYITTDELLDALVLAYLGNGDREQAATLAYVLDARDGAKRVVNIGAKRMCTTRTQLLRALER